MMMALSSSLNCEFNVCLHEVRQWNILRTLRHSDHQYPLLCLIVYIISYWYKFKIHIIQLPNFKICKIFILANFIKMKKIQFFYILQENLFLFYLEKHILYRSTSKRIWYALGAFLKMLGYERNISTNCFPPLKLRLNKQCCFYSLILPPPHTPM